MSDDLPGSGRTPSPALNWRLWLGAVAGLALLATTTACGTPALGDEPARGTVGPPTNTVTPMPTASPTLPPVDGSLGDANTRLACTLLTKAEIEAQFGAPVGEPIPVYPTCRWAVGETAFVSVLVAPGVTLDEVPSHAPATKRASADGQGLGPGAYFGTNRNLYFANEQAAYWVTYQEVNDYISIAQEELIGLARAILAKPLPAGSAPAGTPPPVTGVGLGPPVVDSTYTAQDPLRIFFAGDSMAAGPSWGLSDVIENLPAVRMDAEYQVGSGMTRHDYFDWYRHLAAIAAGLQPQVIVWQSGANDRQPIRVNGELARLDTPEWDAEYGRRTAAYMQALTSSGRKLIWIGLPPMEDPDADAFARKVNGLYTAAAERHPGVTYVDAYQLFAGPDGGYAYELSVDGEERPVRTPDGTHLNVAGSLRLAHEVLRQLGEVTGVALATASPVP